MCESNLASHYIQNNLEQLCLKVGLILFCSCPLSSLQHWNNLSLQSLSNFALASSSREFGYGNQAFDFLMTLRMVDTGNIKVSGDGLVALRFFSCLSMILCLTSSGCSLLFFLLSMFIVVRTVRHNSRVNTLLHLNWLNEWLLDCRHLWLKVSWRWITCLKYNYFFQLQKIAGKEILSLRNYKPKK